MTNKAVSMNRTHCRSIHGQLFWNYRGVEKVTGRDSMAHDFYEVFESTAWLWRILGMFPIVVTNRSGEKRYEFSKFYATCNILTFVVSVSDVGFAIIQYEDQLRTVAPISLSSMIIRLFASMVCMTFSNIWRIIAFKELSETLNDLSEQNKILEKVNCRFNYESSARLIYTYVFVNFFVMIILVAYDTYVTYSKLGRVLVEWTLWMLPTVIQTMDLTILGSLIGWLGLNFRCINEKLTDVVTRANASSPKVLVTSNVCGERLRVLSKTHYNICAIGRRINHAFNFSVIVNVTTAFIMLSTTLYAIFYEARRSGKMNFQLIFSYAGIEVNYSIPIILIVIICNWTTTQAMDAGKLIHEICVHKSDSLLYDAVKSFSLQLHHQKLEFTGAGFFPLNSSLLQRMAATITTYLVILIQFEPKMD